MGKLDPYGKRLLLVAGMFGVAAVLATVTSVHAGRALSQPRQAEVHAEPLAAVQPLSEAEESTASRQDASPADAVQQPETDAGFFVVVRTEPGRQLSVLQPQGACLQTVTANERGDATFSGLLPGRYRIVSGTCGGDFWLWENAAVTALSGTLWSDGELLHLTDTPTVSVRLLLKTTEEQAGRVVTVTLTSKEGLDYHRSFVAGEPELATVEYDCITPGDYRIRIDNKIICVVTVTDETEQEFWL